MESGTPGPPPAAGGDRPRPTGALAPPGQRPTGQARLGPAVAPYEVVTEFDRQEEYNRWLPLVKWLLLLPHWFVLVFVGIARLLRDRLRVVRGAVHRQVPAGHPPLRHRATYRWTTRVTAYGLLMTDRYPPFSLDPDDDYPARSTSPTPSRSRAGGRSCTGCS